MKKHLTAVIIVAMLAIVFMNTPIVSFANSLDEVINGQSSDDSNNENSGNSGNNEQQVQPTQQQSQINTDQYLNDLSKASSLDVDFKGTSNAQAAIKKVASIIVQILSYFLVAFLVVRIIVDLIYIALPFTRSFLANGYGGNAAAGGGGMGMQQPGMGGMGMGGMAGGMGMGRMGMGGMGMNRMGMGGMQGGMQGGQMGATPAMGRTQWVSSAALNAVASESMPGPDGKPQSALKYYAKDMTIVLVITPVLLTLAITGTLTDLGFLLGDLISKGITSFSNSL